MGNLIRNCFRPKNQENISLLVLGLRNSGKTDICYRVLAKKRDEYLETNGCRVFPAFKVLKRNVKLTELGGDHFFDIWKYYFLDAMGIIFVVDSSDTHMLDRSKQVFSTIFTNELLTGKPFLLLANKKDVKNAVDYLDICDYFNVEHLANFYRTPCLLEECGHFEGDQKILKKSVEWLIKTIQTNYKTIQNKIRFLRLLTTNEGSVIEEFPSKKPKRALTGKRKKRIRFSSDRPKSAPALKMRFSMKKNYLIKGKHSPELQQKSTKSRKHNKVTPVDGEIPIATSHNNFSTSIDEPDPDFAQPPLSLLDSLKWEPKPGKVKSVEQNPEKLANGSAKIENREMVNQISREFEDLIVEDLAATE